MSEVFMLLNEGDKALSCDQVRELFEDFLFSQDIYSDTRIEVAKTRGQLATLDDEQSMSILRGRVQGHLLMCEECCMAFAERTRKAVDSGEIIIDIPPVPEISFINTAIPVGYIWNDELSDDRKNILILALLAAINIWVKKRYPIRDYVQTLGEVTCNAKVLNRSYESSRIKDVTICIIENPKIMEDGNLTAHFTANDLSYNDCTLALTLDLQETEKLTILCKLKQQNGSSELTAIINENISSNLLPDGLNRFLEIPTDHWKVHIII